MNRREKEEVRENIEYKDTTRQASLKGLPLHGDCSAENVCCLNENNSTDRLKWSLGIATVEY